MFKTKQVNVEQTTVRVLADGRMRAGDAALYIGLAAKTLAQYRSQGVGPAYIKRGGKIWYYLRALDDWLREGSSK